MPDLITEHTRIDAILDLWRGALGRDYPAYRGHVYRMFNFCRALHPADEDEDAIAIAAAFHDMGIWSDRTFDYLPPSLARANAYIAADAPQVLPEQVEAMIEWHHKLTACSPALGPAAEAFRRADLVDVSLGLVSAGLPRPFVREVRAAFPNAGFHWRLVQLSVHWFLRHPLRPMPMLRW